MLVLLHIDLYEILLMPFSQYKYHVLLICDFAPLKIELPHLFEIILGYLFDLSQLLKF